MTMMASSSTVLPVDANDDDDVNDQQPRQRLHDDFASRDWKKPSTPQTPDWPGLSPKTTGPP